MVPLPPVSAWYFCGFEKMGKLSVFNDPAQWIPLAGKEGIPALPDTEWHRLSPVHHFVLHENRRILARCSVWTDSLPEWNGKIPGAIGHFEAIDRMSGKEVLEAATQWLKSCGRRYAIGPINANTWNPYRLITRSDGRPPFFMEPDHPAFYTDLWHSLGFEPVAGYLSAEVPLKLREDPRLERTVDRLRKVGIGIRNLDPKHYENELRGIYSVSCRAFAENFFYTRIGEKEFLELYSPYRERLDPRLVFLAEKDGNVVGFLFGVPDLLQAGRGEEVDTVIYKTVATLPKRELAGLGLWLSHMGHGAAADLGYQRVVHALITSQSRLGDLQWDDVDVFREYSLFGKNL